MEKSEKRRSVTRKSENKEMSGGNAVAKRASVKFFAEVGALSFDDDEMAVGSMVDNRVRV